MLWTETVYKKKHLAWYFPNLNMLKYFIKNFACFFILHIEELPRTFKKKKKTNLSSCFTAYAETCNFSYEVYDNEGGVKGTNSSCHFNLYTF